NGDFACYVPKLAPSGALGYSTYIGGPGRDDALAITVGAGGNAYGTGKTSGGYPTTAGAYDRTENGGYDAFAAKLARDGSALVYCTYLGGDSWDEGLGIGVDATGNAYLAGNVQSPNFPTTAGAWDRSLSGTVDGF